jgi:hypothetical protein
MKNCGASAFACVRRGGITVEMIGWLLEGWRMTSGVEEGNDER